MRLSAREIVKRLGGEWHGHYGLCPAPYHSRKDRGMSIWDNPDLEGGIGVSLFSGGDWKGPRAYLIERGLLEREPYKPRDALSVIVEEKRRKDREREGRAAEKRRIETRQAHAVELWMLTLPIAGTPVERYLRGARGISGSISENIRYLPFCPYVLTRDGGRCVPAMVAKVERYGAVSPCIHITFLSGDGTKSPYAAAQGAPRKVLAPSKGGGVRLGARSDGGGVIAIAEGIESALSYSMCHSIPCDAALSASGLTSWEPPPSGWRELHIAHDNDKAGKHAALNLRAKIIARGFDVKLTPPPNGHNDWNDYVLRK